MPMEITLKQCRCGPTLKLNFTVACEINDLREAITEPINVTGMALVRFQFRYVYITDKYHLFPFVSTKKSATNTYDTVKINVTSNMVEKELICSDDWVEYELQSKIREACSDRMFNTTLSVNITAYGTNFLLLKSEKLYEDDEFTDFQLHAADGTVAMHKSVLSIYSDVFKSMLKREEWKESKEGTIDLAEVTVQTLQYFKSFMYLGTLPEDNEGLKDLLVFASRYMIDTVKAGCILKLVKNVTSENMDDLIDFACQNNMPDLIRALIRHDATLHIDF